MGAWGWFEFAFSNACIQLLQYLVLKYLIQEKSVHSVTRIWDYNVHFITLMKDETCASLVAAQNNNSYNKLIIPKVSRSNNQQYQSMHTSTYNMKLYLSTPFLPILAIKNAYVSAYCGCDSTCTDEVWKTLATDASGSYTCGGRITWLQSDRGYSERDACIRVSANEFPNGPCGPACDPNKCNNDNPSPSPPTPLQLHITSIQSSTISSSLTVVQKRLQ